MHTTADLFATPAEAEAALHDLLKQGFGEQEPGFVSPGQRAQPNAGPAESPASREGASPDARHCTGKLTKATRWGGSGGLVLAQLTLPGIGWVAAAATVATALIGAGPGALAGSMVGAMDSLGLAKDACCA